MMKNLDEGKMYFRQLCVNGTKCSHKEFSNTGGGYYINGIELFKSKGFYWLKTYTSWNDMVCINSILKINKNNKVLKFYLNTFGFSGAKPKLWERGGEKEELVDWIECINQHLDSDDEERRVVIKDRPDIK